MPRFSETVVNPFQNPTGVALGQNPSPSAGSLDDKVANPRLPGGRETSGGSSEAVFEQNNWLNYFTLQ